jgi:hypothetical protein
MEAMIMVIAAVIFVAFSGCKVTHNIHHEGETPTEEVVQEVPAPPTPEELTD